MHQEKVMQTVVPCLQPSAGQAEVGGSLSSRPAWSSGQPGLHKEILSQKTKQRLERPPTALPEVLSSIPSNHMVAHSHLYQDWMPSSGVLNIDEEFLFGDPKGNWKTVMWKES